VAFLWLRIELNAEFLFTEVRNYITEILLDGCNNGNITAKCLTAINLTQDKKALMYHLILIIQAILGFRCDVNEICAVLGFYCPILKD
jgi:hypothetical protein